MQFYKPVPAAPLAIQGIIANQVGLGILGAGVAYQWVPTIVIGILVNLGGTVALLFALNNFVSAHDDMALHMWTTIRVAEQEEEDRAKKAAAEARGDRPKTT